MRLTGLLVTAALAMPVTASAQKSGTVQAPFSSMCFTATDGTQKCIAVSADNPLPSIGKQETFRLVSGNVPSEAVTLAGGDYVLDQACASYGTVTFARLGPDARTYFTMGTYSASDTGNAHLFKFGSYAKVKVTVSGTAGCNVLIARVPA